VLVSLTSQHLPVSVSCSFFSRWLPISSSPSFSLPQRQLLTAPATHVRMLRKPLLGSQVPQHLSTSKCAAVGNPFASPSLLAVSSSESKVGKKEKTQRNNRFLQCSIFFFAVCVISLFFWFVFCLFCGNRDWPPRNETVGWNCELPFWSGPNLDWRWLQHCSIQHHFAPRWKTLRVLRIHNRRNHQDRHDHWRRRGLPSALLQAQVHR